MIPQIEAVIDPQLVVDMIQKRNWLPLGALAVGLVVRLLKSDIKIFPSIDNPRFRIWACLALGQLAGTIEAVIAGKTYREAILWGAVQSGLAIFGHNLFIESIRGGKEFVIPGLTKIGVAPSPGAPPSIPAPLQTEKDLASGGTSIEIVEDSEIQGKKE